MFFLKSSRILPPAAILISALCAASPGNSDKPAAKPAVTTAAAIAPPPAGHRLPEGLVLSYKAEWRLLNAGTAKLRVSAEANGEDSVNASADSTGLVAKLYRVHDSFQSAFNRATFCSRQITKRTEEGSRRRQVQIVFDYAQGKSVRQEVDLKSGARKQVENSIPACATDILSALFYASLLPLEPGAVYRFPVNDGGKTATLEAWVEGRERIKTPAGAFETIRVQPRSDSGIIKKKQKIWIWYSDDAERLPVQIRAKMGWGTLTLELQRVEREPR